MTGGSSSPGCRAHTVDALALVLPPGQGDDQRLSDTDLSRSAARVVYRSAISMRLVRHYSREDRERWRYHAVRVLWHQSGALPSLVQSVSLPGASV